MPPKRVTKMAYRGEAKRRSTRLMSQHGKGPSLVVHEHVAYAISSSTSETESAPRTESFHSVGNENLNETHAEAHTNVPVSENPIENPEQEVHTSENAPNEQLNQDPLEEEPFDSSRFINKASELKYDENYSRRVVLCERGIKLEDYSEAPFKLLELFDQKSWVHWVTTSRRAVVPYVREFHSNAEMGMTHGRAVINSRVRGKDITLNCEKISFIGHLPTERVPETTLEQKAQWEAQLHKDNLAKIFTDNPQAEWTTARLSKIGITPKSNVLHMIVCSSILPHAYKSTITVEQATIMGKLLLGIPVDLSYHIWMVIAHAVEKPESNAGLPFGGLITEILQHFLGLEEEVGMATIKSASVISRASMKRSQGQLKKVASLPVGNNQQPQQPTKHEEATGAAPMSTEERLDLLQKNQELLIKEVAKLRQGQQKLTRLMERIFESDREEDD